MMNNAATAAQQELKRFVASIATLSRLGDASRSELFAMLLVDRTFSPRVISFAETHGLVHLLPQSYALALQEPAPTLLQRWPASRIVAFCNANTTPTCLHLSLREHGSHLSVAFGLHYELPSCQPLSFPHASKLCENILLQNAFGILICDGIHCYAVRAIAEYDDGSVIAECYGLERQILLKEKTPKGENL